MNEEVCEGMDVRKRGKQGEMVNEMNICNEGMEKGKWRGLVDGME